VTERVSISKSVARAFRVLELFDAERKPLTAADIGRRLALPQPSARALLKTLVQLGYLAYATADRTYRPTRRLATLGRWLDDGPPVPAALATAADRIAGRAGETTSLCTLKDGRVEILHVCKAQHPVALQLEPGIGAEGWRSAVGRVLLAALPEEQSAGLIRGWLRQSRAAAARRALGSLRRDLQQIRRDGHFAGYDLFLPGVGAVCSAVDPRDAPAAMAPLAIAVAGLRDRIRRREVELLRMIRAGLRNRA
jgi:DNA-binding IclR family transcriptional regulator